MTWLRKELEKQEMELEKEEEEKISFSNQSRILLEEKLLGYQRFRVSFLATALIVPPAFKELCRHGDRKPDSLLESYEADPYKDENFDGTLTDNGRKRELDLGKFLRSKYNEFLGSTYVPGCIEARSTNANRTKESANLILEGLYPGAVIPVISKFQLNDALLYPQLCPGYLKNYLEAKSDTRKEREELKECMEHLTNSTGQTINSTLDMYLLYVTLDAEHCMNFELPSWTSDIYPDGDLLKGTLLEFHIQNYNEKMIIKNGGKFINKIREDMESVKSGEMDKNRKLMLYVAHDLNIVAVLKGLDVFDPHVPKYSASLILELHLIDETYHVKIEYYLGMPAELKTLQIPGCAEICPLDQFSTLMEKYIPSGFDWLCDKMRGFGNLVEAFSETVEKFKQLFGK
ncbi:venom acid phosphatase Acph-1-like [Belonocnema kinseyi]|uniref:venom acid phosphatase Acph-1-like n=1 Tax=Belonocnema kinseyi TaxID=2817044 RepID=UPI00143CDCE8|nr:venom acid phosphatase Acph-1-like [Belonocnema kinseyi]